MLIRAAHAAAEAATRYIGGDLNVTHKPDDAGPVTAADLAANTAIEDILRPARPRYGWLSEESAERTTGASVFIIDPIDGTRSFIEGSSTWAHSLAIATQGTVTAAVVYLPMRDKIYTSALGHGAFLNGAAIKATKARKALGANILTTRPNLSDTHWPRGVPGFKRSHRPSLAYRLSLVAEGRYDAMFTFRPSWEWDIAAGSLIAAEAGATLTTRTGEPLKFDNPTPQTDGVIAAAPDLHRDLMRYLTP